MIRQGRNLIATKRTDLSIDINEPPAPASGTGRIKKVMGDRRAFDRMAPGPSGEILPAGGSCLIALGRRSVDAICPAPARQRRPSESVGGGNKTNLSGPRGDRPLSKRHEAGRHIGRVDRIHRRREQFNRHGNLVCQLSIYRQFRPIKEHVGTLAPRRDDLSPPKSVQARKSRMFGYAAAERKEGSTPQPSEC
jgi:hypothetical protein